MLDREIQWVIEEKYQGNAKALELQADILRLKAGEPVAYVIGFVDFLGVRIDLSEHPLIPRSETEFWVGEVIKELKARENLACLDIFSGSGCVGISVLQHVPDSEVTFAEKEPRFIDQIGKNLVLNNIDQSRYHLCGSDVFSSIKGTYDLILANPPYAAESRKTDVQESVLKYEPYEAVFAPDNGLFYIKELIRRSPNFLNEEGSLCFEFDDPQYEEIKKLGEESPFMQSEMFKDQYGKWRWARLTI